MQCPQCKKVYGERASRCPDCSCWLERTVSEAPPPPAAPRPAPTKAAPQEDSFGASQGGFGSDWAAGAAGSPSSWGQSSGQEWEDSGAGGWAAEAGPASNWGGASSEPASSWGSGGLADERPTRPSQPAAQAPSAPAPSSTGGMGSWVGAEAAAIEQQSGWLGAGGSAATATATAVHESDTIERVPQKGWDEGVEDEDDWVDELLEEEPTHRVEDYDDDGIDYYGSGRKKKFLVVILLLAALGMGVYSVQNREPAEETPTVSKAAELIEAGLAYQEKGEHLMARAKAKDALKASPSPEEQADAYYLLAEAEFNLKNYKDSYEAAENLPEGEAQEEMVEKSLGAWDKSQRVKAVEHLKKARGLLKNKNYEACARQAELAKALFVDHQGGRTQLAEAYALIARGSLGYGDLSAAEVNAEKAMWGDPKYKSLYDEVTRRIRGNAPRRVQKVKVQPAAAREKAYPTGNRHVRRRASSSSSSSSSSGGGASTQSQPARTSNAPRRTLNNTNRPTRSKKWVPISQRGRKIKGL